LNAEIVTSKSSEMNILVPKGADGDFVKTKKKFKFLYLNFRQNFLCQNNSRQLIMLKKINYKLKYRILF